MYMPDAPSRRNSIAGPPGVEALDGSPARCSGDNSGRRTQAEAVTPNASGRLNRVAPDGDTAAVADRGLFWGNRGRLLNTGGELVRHSAGRNWIICALEFHGRHRMQWRPNRLTELYFLDEV